MPFLEPPGGWLRFFFWFVPVLVLVLEPWPGLADAFSSAMASLCNAIAAAFVGAGAEVHFSAAQYLPEHPWWIQLFVKNVFTGQSFRVPVDSRTVAFVRIAVFAALAISWPLGSTARWVKAAAVAFAILIGSIVLTVLLPLAQVLGMVRVWELGVLAQSVLSVGILTLTTYPGMAFAVPALLWIAALYLGRGGARKRPSASGPLAGVPH